MDIWLYATTRQVPWLGWVATTGAYVWISNTAMNLLCNSIGDIEHCTIQNSSLFQASEMLYYDATRIPLARCFSRAQMRWRIHAQSCVLSHEPSNGQRFMPGSTAAMAQVCVIASLMGTIALASPQYGHPLLKSKSGKWWKEHKK